MVRFESLPPVSEASTSDNEALSSMMQKLEDIDNEIAMIPNSIRANSELPEKFPRWYEIQLCAVRRIGNGLSIITLVDVEGFAGVANDYGGINCCISFKREAASRGCSSKDHGRM